MISLPGKHMYVNSIPPIVQFFPSNHRWFSHAIFISIRHDRCAGVRSSATHICMHLLYGFSYVFMMYAAYMQYVFVCISDLCATFQFHVYVSHAFMLSPARV